MDGAAPAVVAQSSLVPLETYALYDEPEGVHWPVVVLQL